MSIRKTFFGILLLSGMLLASSCQSNDPADCNRSAPTTKAPAGEVAALKQYIETARINATADERGFYYTIHSPGTGPKPSVCSDVTVNYAGRLTSGSTFETASDVRFNLSGLILGWQQGIPLISPGGSITLYLPPSLAYGAQAQQGIPANSILIFDIDLISVR
jgi:FKBP-type peptidyl-prolyl cis-trans isomerase FkpA